MTTADFKLVFTGDDPSDTGDDPSYFDIQFTSEPLSSNTWYDAWCLDPDLAISVRFDRVPFSYTGGTLYSSYENTDLLTSLPKLAGFPADQLDEVNWLLNFGSTTINPGPGGDGAVSQGELQSAMWWLLGYDADDSDSVQQLYTPVTEGTLDDRHELNDNLDANFFQVEDVDYLIQQAELLGNGFVPSWDNNEVIGLVIDPGGNLQPIIVEVPVAKLGDFVWEDLNADGVQQAGEAGIDGVTVQLLDASGNVVRSTVTGAGTDDPNTLVDEGAAGYYEFDGLTPGLDYQVRFETPAGFDAVSPRQEDDGNADPTARDSDGLTSDVVVLAPGEFDRTIDAGFYKTAGLGDFVWEDLDRDGQQDANELGVGGVTVELKDGNGNVVATTATAADGSYSFTGLVPGAYSVVFTPPAGYAFTDPNVGDDALDSDADPAMGGMTQEVVLTSGEFNGTLDAGLVQGASLGDFVFLDKDADGIQDAGEVGIGGVEVTLVGGGADGVIGTGGDDTSATTSTDGTGFYQFTALNPGEEYQVVFTQPADFEVSPADQGGDDTVDSDGLVAPVVTLTSGENNPTIDQGFYELASLGDFVWEDLDGDGTQDAGEPGVAGVTVELKDGNGNVVATTATDGNGAYSFTGLVPGAYSVVFTPPAGYAFTDLNVGDDALDSDADPAMGGMTQEVVLTSGEFNGTLDAGLVRPASIGDTVFEDTNGNGQQDAGEGGVENVTVELYTCVNDQPGVLVATTTTDATGNYGFDGLEPGEYIVKFITPSGFTLTTANVGDDETDSDAGAGGLTGCYKLESGESNDTVDAGLVQGASLGDFVFLDKDADGIQDAGEVGIGGVEVTLVGGGADGVIGTGGDDTSATTSTDGTGFYQFTALNPGEEYQVVFTQPADFEVSPADQGGDDTVDSDGLVAPVVTLASGENNPTIDQGFYELASLGDFVWEDLDGDGTQDAGEPGVAGVTVELKDGNGNVVATTATDGNGAYSFTGLVPGAYSVVFTPPAGYAFTDLNVGDDALDSDADPAMGGMTQEVVLTSGEFNGTLDAGLVQGASLGDFVFLDADADGIQDTGEGGIGGVEVTLVGGGADGVIGTGGDDTSATTSTDGTGFYQFTALNPGEEYQVVFTQPADFEVSPADQGGDDTVDSDGLVAPVVTLTSGENNPTIDQGFYELASLGDFVWEDLDGDGTQGAGEPGVAGVTVELKDGNGNVVATTATDGNGAYSFTGLVPGAYSVVFTPPAGYAFTDLNVGDDALDSDADPAMGGMTQEVVLTSGEFNGTLDAGLVRPASIGDTVFEDTNGNGQQDAGEGGVENVTVELYTCVNDQPDVLVATTTTDATGNYGFDGLEPGEYIVKFITPSGFTLTTANVGDDETDSDAGAGGLTGCYKLESGESNDTVDAGLVQGASLGDFVFLDKDADGIQDAGEVGIGGVEVTLVGGGADGVIGTGGDDTSATTSTDGTGFYQFTALNPGEEYQVVFTQPADFEVSPADQGGDDTVDSDGLVAPVVTLTSGENNPTIDQGFYELASLGDFVWEDANGDGVQQETEAGIAGVLVNLLDCDNNPILDGNGNPVTTTTGSNGEYSFTGLVPGEYKVQFITPDGYVLTGPDRGGDDTLDSDAGADGITIDCYVLESGEIDDTIDAGMFRPASLGDFVFEDTNANGIQDAGEEGIDGATVTLIGDVDGDGVVDTLTTETGDNPDTPEVEQGYYEFKDLVPGDYAVIFTTPDGYTESSPANVGVDDTKDSDGPAVGTTLETGEDDPTLDSGFYNLASLGDFVWEDLDGDGTQGAGEPGVAGVTVELKDGNGNVVATTATDGNGAYSFTGLVPGAYSVVFTPPAGYAFTDLNVGDDALDSDADPAMGGMTQEVVLTSGEFNGTLDAGLVRPASIGDTVFEDTNGNGQQDAGEGGVENVTVELYTCVNDQPDVLVATTTTDATGNYGFDGLEPGEYIVKFITPSGFTLTTANVGDDETDSDAGAGGLTGCYKLESGESNDTVDAGLTSDRPDIDIEKLVAIETPGEMFEGFVCEVFGKPVSMTFLYNTGTTVDTLQDSDKADILVDNGADDDGMSWVVVTDKSNAFDTGGKVYFKGFVSEGEEFTPEINADADKFGSSTFVHFFDDANGASGPGTGLLQSLTYHTSCSQPIQLGDVVGNVELVGYSGEDGAAPVEPPTVTAYFDADDPSGPVAVPGQDTALFRYEVTNTGDVDELANVVVTDDRIGDIKFVGGDDDGDNLLDFGETWIYEASEAAAEGLRTNTGTVTGEGNGTTVTDSDDANYVGLDAPPAVDIEKYVRVEGYTPFVPMVCETYGKPVEMTFRYEVDADNESVSNTQEGKAEILSSQTLADADGTSYVVVSDSDKPFDTGAEVFFAGEVAEGGEFTAAGDFGSETFIHYFESKGDFDAEQGLLQSLTYHTSCSKPINLGDETGYAQLVGYVGEQGAAMPINEFGEDADLPDGPEAEFGSTVEFTYVVTNPGGTALGNVQVTDDRLDPLTFVEGDTDSDGLLDTDETWIYTASEEALVGQVTNTGTVTAEAVGDNGAPLGLPEVSDEDDANYVVVNGPAIDIEKYVRVEGYTPFVPMVCETYGKPVEMTFRYEVDADNESVSNTQEGKAEILSSQTLADADGTSYVVVSDSDKPFDTGAEVFFAGEVAEGGEFTAAGDFGSETFIHYFESKGDFDAEQGLLQSLTYHTSCSKPINLGDETGYAQLVGYVGEQGAAMPINEFGEDADLPDGPEAEFGSTVEFTYVVTNPGGTALGNVQVTDDRLDPLTFVEGDTDSDGLLDTDETWIYTASEEALVGQVTNTGTVTAEAVGDNGAPLGLPEVSDEDDANYVVVNGPAIDIEKYVRVEGYTPFVPMVCETYGKPVEMTFRYEVDADNESVSNTQEGKAEILSSQTLADADGTSYVVVSDSDKPFDTGAEVFFAGEVAEGGEFTAAGDFGSETFIHYFESKGDFDAEQGLLQSLTYHTSCSKPINLGDETGYAQLVGYVGEQGAAMPINEFGEDADTGPGPEALIGDEVVFNYVVTNPGSAPLDDIKLVDDQIPNLTFLGGDDGDGLLESGEEWLYTGSETATEGSNTNVALATGTAVDGNGIDLGLPEVTDSDAANYTGVDELTPTFAVCEEFGKPIQMEWRYDPSQEVDTSQDESKAGVEFESGLVDDDGISFIRVSDKSNAEDTSGKQYFEGAVAVGEDLIANIYNAATDKFGSETFVHIFDDNPDVAGDAAEAGASQGLLQSMNYHTSCSQPIFLGDQVGGVTLVGYQGESGEYGIV